MLGTHKDLTQDKDREQELTSAKLMAQDHARELKRAQKTAKIGSWKNIVSTNNMWWSEEMYNIFGINKKSFSGDLNTVIEELTHPDDKHLVQHAHKTVFQDKKSISVEFRIKTEGGAKKHLLFIADDFVRDENGEYKVLSGVMKDITDYKLIQIELEKAKEKAEESDRLKSSFLANMSHEIRTPMNSIIGFASILKNNDTSLKQREKYIDIITNSSNHLLNLINDIIDISKIESGEVVVSYTDIELNALFHELYSFYHSELRTLNKFGVYLKMKIPYPEFYISTDETRLRQVLINLIGNAVKFTDSGEIEFGYGLKGDKIEFFVRDTGIGIARDKQDMIFKRFHQESETTERLYGGTGLGLAIAKACTELLKGEIWLESVQNFGTTFYFTVEYAKGKQANEIFEVENKEFEFDNELILVAEDDDYNYDYISTILSHHDLRLIRTKSGRETIRMALSHDDLKLVLMDIQMPDLTGSEATIEIRKHKPELPIIAQTEIGRASLVPWRHV
ncbi:MAG: response regulator, partial [Okeania sp. SIO3C4]|nr:response regulator [Okeania sp. SIO3C4]